MGKTIRFNENGLIALKKKLNEIMVGINDVSHNDVCEEVGEEFAPVTKIGGEEKNGDVVAGGNYFHEEQPVNEGYLRNKLSSIDLSEVGRVEYSFDFNEDEYNEWLIGNDLQDSEESRCQFYRDQWEFEVEYFDNETLHHMDSDYGLSYDDLEELFGEKMADTIVITCVRDGGGSFETDELYDGEKVDINNPQELNAFAMKLLRHGNYFKDCRGFILTNGIVIYTDAEHNEVLRIPGITNKFQFIKLGNIRILPNSIDIGAEPTREQRNVLRQLIASYSDGKLYVDIFSPKDGEIGAKYYHANYNYVLGEIDRYYSDGIRPRGGSFDESKDKEGTLVENLEPEVSSSEVDLSSFKKRDSLPPKIWKNEETLDSKVRLKLLDIADDFWEFVNLSWVEPKGIIITGSICNFNWSKFSGIDLHLIVDFSEIDSKTEFVKQYLDSKKNEWNNEHEGLKIMGFTVELYVQDVNENPEAGGIYDLEENAWVRKPNPHTIKSIGLNKFDIKDKAAEIMTIIDDMYDMLSSTSDAYVLDQVGEDAHYLWDKVKDLRKKSLKKHGESGSGNIVYKVLRRTGYLDRLFKLFSVIYNKSNSITESNLHLLTESQESKSIEEAKRLLIARGGVSEERADWMVRYALRHDMPAFSRNPKAGKFILGIVRMYADREITDATTVLRLDDTIRIAALDEYSNQFDRNLNGMSAQDFIDMFAPTIRAIKQKYREDVNSMTITHSDRYTIVPIRDFRHATEFEKDCDWCLCENSLNGERSYDSYTCDGLCQLYFCLRDDYETVDKVIGEGCPLDDYGLSMIAVCVDEEGDLRTCTSRWNHENGGNDKIMNPVEISNVIGRNFYDEFKPNRGNRYVESVNRDNELPLVNESKEMLNEFLDKNYGIPLYKYFQWAEKASDREKVENLFYHCPWIIGKYLDNVSDYDEELSELEDELLGDRDLEYDDEYIERVLDALERHGLLTKLLDYPYAYAAAEELPAWFIMSFIRLVKNEWCIHFTSDANNIARKGFTGGTPEVEDIAYTNAGREKPFAGYDFAFLINDSSVDFNGYGDEAVIFRASGVLLLHYGDEQRQVVFWGPSVKELIPIKKDDYSSDWIIEGLNGQVFKTGKPSELADWATNNLPQYRNQILAGKSGYRPWGYSRPAFDNEFMKLPLNNESVKKYLTLLKEETAMDGSSEDNPYEKRWKAERNALKNFIANYGKLMQSREDNKGGKLYKVYYDETMSNLIGYNYCICVQWNEQEMKPGSTVYIRALDKFTPFIRRNLQFDTRGRDNMRGTADDTGY